MEFWNDQTTDQSWSVLNKLAKKYKFILIGGWACHLHTGTMKSKDIDIVIDFETLSQIKKDLPVGKNVFLKKYETVVDSVSVDIYVPFFSEFVIPFDCIKKNIIRKQGIKIPKPEILLILKQQAELARKDSVKGQKDRIDIINILINSDVDIKKYLLLAKKYKIKNYLIRLKYIIKTSGPEFEYLGITDPRKIKMLKKELIKKLTSE